MIPDQVRLPLRVAYGVVLQGIRIRFGRSVVTIMGVMFGVAFLMAILTGEVVKRGVSDEDRIRTEVKRMYSFLTSEMGPPAGKSVGVIQVGTLNELERRLIDTLGKEGVERVRWVRLAPELPPAALKRVAVVATSLEEVGEDASAVLVVGDGTMPGGISWTDVLLHHARQQVVGVTRQSIAVHTADDDAVSVVTLDRELRPDELEKLEQARKKNRARTIWIVCAALLVTVIGISNAMFMSVTERFREIGTMKCLGALSSFVRQIFLLESSLVGLVGGAAGAVVGMLFSVVVYGLTYGFGIVVASLNWIILALGVAGCTLLGIVLAVVAALYPARIASSMIPAAALRTEI